MTAGTGADEQARRIAERAAALRAQADALEVTERKWVAGAEGERLVGGSLDGLGPGWRVVHDVHWPGRPKANLDHVAVGPTGVWVVDAKNWTGRVTMTEGVLRQNGYRRVDNTEAAARAAAAVAALLEPQHRLLVQPVICLAGEGRQLPPTSTSSWVVGLDHLPALLTSGSQCLTAGETIAISRFLAGHLGGPTSPAQLTTAAAASTSTVVQEPAQASRPAGRSSRNPVRTAAGRPEAQARTRSTGGRRSSEVFGQLVRVALILLVIWVFSATMPVWVPVLAELISGTLAPALMPEAPTPPATVVP